VAGELTCGVLDAEPGGAACGGGDGCGALDVVLGDVGLGEVVGGGGGGGGGAGASYPPDPGAGSGTSGPGVRSGAGSGTGAPPDWA